MPSNYAAIRREKSEDYVELAEKVSEQLLSRQYADRAHFVFELLQNAEDALRRRRDGEVPRRVRLSLEKDAVRFSHFGSPFDEKDVRAVCEILVSTKDEETDIGHFGIGFKAVGAVTDRPKIHSGDERFAIERYVLPFCIPATDLQRDETLITLPLRDGDAIDDIARQLACLGDERTLLFLREIDEIEWSVEDGGSGCYRRETTDEGEDVRRVRLFGEVDGEETSEEVWLVFSREVYNDGRHARHVEVAFRVETDEAGRDVIVPVHGQHLVAFFPTAMRTDVGILVQGPYVTTPSRDRVQWADERNHRLVAETADLLVYALRHLRDRRLLTARVLNVLPLSRSRFPDGSHFAPLFDAVKDAIASERLLPMYRGGYVPASQARLTSNEDLRERVSREQLAKLLGEDEPVAWLSAEITRSATPELYSHLTDEQGVREFNAKALLMRLDKQFIENQSDWWIARLYGFLGRGDTWEECEYFLYDVPFIRLEDDTHTAPGDEADAFLPTVPPSGYPNTVHAAVCNTRPAWDFLAESVGLRTPDLVDDIESDVLPRYRETDFVIAEDEYVADLQRFLSVYAADSGERQRRLVAALSDTPFVLAADAATCEQSFVRPGGAYLATDRFRALFDGVPGVLLVDDSLDWKEVTELLRACGAGRTLAPVDVSHRFTHDQRREVRRRASERRITHHYGETVMDWEFRGLRGLLEHFPELSPEDAKDRARILWDALREADRDSFRGRYSWFYRTRRLGVFDSASVRLLNEAAWVPDGSGGLRPPADVLFDSLDWEGNQFLQSIIKFRTAPPRRPYFEAAARARQAGYSEDEIAAWIDQGMKSRQEAEAGGERSATPRTGGGQPPRPSFIGVKRESEPTEEGSREHERRMGVEDHAIDFILQRNPSLKRTPTNNPGFDLYEPGDDGEPVRWIEVKALSGEWESNVTLSHTQFDYAREKGDRYWLYVVEHAGTERPKIRKINDPAGWDSTYTFDHGWRAAAEGTDGDD